MFIPLYDSNHLRRIRYAYVNIALILFNVAIYLVTRVGGDDYAAGATLSYGFIPSVVHDIAELSPQFIVIPEQLSYLTYSFLHADIWHLGGNMLFLWVFGDNVEDALGHVRYLIFYLACAAGGAFFHGFVAPGSEQPLIGASGAIAGVVAAYLILYPRVKVWVLAFARIPLRLPAYIVLILWVLLQFVMFAMGGDQQISWACHIGGIVTGAILVLVLRSRGVPLLENEEEAAAVAAPAEIAPAPLPAATEAKPASRWGRQ